MFNQIIIYNLFLISLSEQIKKANKRIETS